MVDAASKPPSTTSEPNNDDQDVEMNNKTLARAFVLDSNNEWITLATGHCICELSEDGSLLNLSLHDEIDCKLVLFSTTFHKDQVITPQQETVVSWHTDSGSEVALSFESEEGCRLFWIDLCKFLGKDPSEELPNEIAASPMHEDKIQNLGGVSGSMLPVQVEFNTLPEFEAILERITSPSSTTSPLDHHSFSQLLIEGSYIPRLLHLFRVAEDLESKDVLHRLFSIFRMFFLLHDPLINRELLSESNLIDLVGVFEHDPQYPDSSPGFRKFLLENGRFKQIVNISNHQLTQLIHRTFRLQYLKDVVLPRFLDEESYGGLLFLVRCNFVEIIDSLNEDPSFFANLNLHFEGDSCEDSVAILKFLKELLVIARSTANGGDLKLFQEDSLKKLLNFLHKMLSQYQTDTQTLATEVLVEVASHKVSAIKSYMMEEPKDSESGLLSMIINILTSVTTTASLRWQLIIFLKCLLEVSPLFSDLNGALNTGIIPNDDFLGYFYPEFATRLLLPLTEIKGELVREKALDHNQAELYYTLMELLGGFIAQHKYRIKYLLFRQLTIHNILHLLASPHLFLRHSALKMVRLMIETEDEFYFRFLIKQMLLKPLLEHAVQLGEEENALTASYLNLFSIIRDKKFKLILNHFCETLKDDLIRIKFGGGIVGVEMMKMYKILNNLEGSSEAKSSSEDEYSKRPKPRDTWLAVDQDEESYFNTGDDEEDIEDIMEEREQEEEEEVEPLTEADLEPIEGDVVDSPVGPISANEVDLPHQMATVWSADPDRTKRLKY